MENYCEIRKHEKDYFLQQPELMKNEFDRYGKLALVDAYGTLFPDGDEKAPVLFVRHGNAASYRFGGFARLAETPTGVQSPEHVDDIAQKEETGAFQQLSDSPWTYGYGTSEPFSEYRYTWDENGLRGTWKEADILDVVAEPFDYCVIQRMGKIANFCEVIQPAIITGTYEGKPIQFLGSFDKVYVPNDQQADIGSTMSYILCLDHGIRPDGKKESFVLYVNAVGENMGIYYLEGEEPVISNDVKMDADWFHQPYSNDGTIMYKDAIFTVGDKKIHFTGKWGTKGITARPRYEKHGQSQIFGSWYEGETPYKHTLENTFHEQLEAYDHRLEKFKDQMGFRIID